MPGRLYQGAIEKTGSVDSEGHREYKATFLVFTDPLDGPAEVLLTPGLPLVGTPWIIDNDVDPWAWRRPEATVKPHQGKQGTVNHWTVEFTFSTKPPDNKKQRCSDNKIEDPLLEPPKVSGGFTKYTEEATRDRFGNPVRNSAWEQIRGATVEFDASRPTVKIEQNVGNLGLEVFSPMIDTVNAAPLWGLGRRKIKLTNVSWERKYHGLCYKYYTRNLEFEIRYDGWDRDIMDEGTKVLNGEWDTASGLWTLLPINGAVPDVNDPKHFIRYKDRNGENSRVILNGGGRPYTPSANDVTHECTQCLGGTPKYWRVEGFNITSEVVVENFGACNWSTSLAEGQFNLEYDPTEKLWIFRHTVGASLIASYSRDKDDWVCFGPNTLHQIESTVRSAPQSITLMAGSQPGNIHIEKYRESNFLILGIPVVL